MTNQEAIEFLKNMIDRESIGFVAPSGEGDVAIWQYHVEALQMAIKALELATNLQPTCNQFATDCISRQAAIDAINTMFAPTPTQRDMVEDCLEILDNLPSAQPETHDKRTETHACDLIDRQQVLNLFPTHDWKHLYDAVKDLPSAQPESEHTMEEFMYGQDLGRPEDGSL